MMFAIEAIKTIAIAAVILSLVPVLIWFERKGAAYFQDRRGPNRAHILGIRLGGVIHSISDVVKLLTKEDIVVAKANKFFYILAPMLTMSVALSTLGVIPFTEPLQIGDYLLKLQIADLNVGFLYIIAISSMGVYGVMLGGWSSNNNYSLLGGLRASAQMISYEISMGLALVALLVAMGTARLPEIVMAQSGSLFNWNAVHYPLTFILFIVALFAEANRTPFDLPEGESELVAGFHSEYSSMKFALFFMGEYTHIAVGSALLSVLFFGGWNLPWVTTDMWRLYLTPIVQYGAVIGGLSSALLGFWMVRRFRVGRYGDARDYEVLVFGLPMIGLGLAIAVLGWFVWPGLTISPMVTEIIIRVIQFKIMLIKVLFFSFFFVWVRWTVPRFRYDQLMHLGWRIMLPLALANIIIVSACKVWWH